MPSGCKESDEYRSSALKLMKLDAYRERHPLSSPEAVGHGLAVAVSLPVKDMLDF